MCDNAKMNDSMLLSLIKVRFCFLLKKICSKHHGTLSLILFPFLYHISNSYLAYVDFFLRGFCQSGGTNEKLELP